MADATSSGSGGSGHSERIKQRLHHRPCAGGTKPTFAGYDSAWEQLSPSTEGRLGDAVKCLHGDRDIARQAVAIVLGATTRKRGLKGAISLCTEVSGLLEANRR
ncbi:hypothetical protein OS493_032694 [Desmophyllum pertusum]|uniref:Uncharacterized protein n=1 Tax=Desmophyllum pertusum TaxID=174260 RepID=A0A9W9ZWL4_9CNID|nr:hypothetical protein OS493_032694 [Desmophyllum pertusum]